MSRKGRKMMTRRKRCWKGGVQTVFPADVNDDSMNSASSLSSAQGLDYESLHVGQHGGDMMDGQMMDGQIEAQMMEAQMMDGQMPESQMMEGQMMEGQSVYEPQSGGAAMSLASAAPPGYTGMLDDSLRGAARISVLDESMQGIQGMSDQSGGRRSKSRKGRKSRKNRGRKNGSMRKRKGSMRKRMRGGYSLSNAQDFGAPGMLLSPSQEATALSGMNPEWKLASDPGAFNPAGM